MSSRSHRADATSRDREVRGWADAAFHAPTAQHLHDLQDMLRGHALSLGHHLQQCRRDRSRWHPVEAVGEQVHDWVGPRFVTTLAVASIGFGLLTFWPA